MSPTPPIQLTPLPHSPYPRPARFGAEEWEARVQLAAAYRIFDHLGWTELIYNHISLRVPGDAAHYLINPFGLHYSEVCASNLVKVDRRGAIVGHSDWPVNPAGITFHGAIHATLPDAHCVMHLHTTATQAVCCLQDGLSFTNFYAAQLFGKVAYHDFEGITVHAEEGARILDSAGPAGAAAAKPRAGDDRPQPAAGLVVDVAGELCLRDSTGLQRHGRAARHPGGRTRKLRRRFAELQPEVRRRSGLVRHVAAPGGPPRPGLPALRPGLGSGLSRPPKEA